SLVAFETRRAVLGARATRSPSLTQLSYGRVDCEVYSAWTALDTVFPVGCGAVSAAARLGKAGALPVSILLSRARQFSL
ncbi:MAG: hypothetical protein OES99_07640, partial [Gammaproteobacteria bacterium]|nr:hypothetical protein [Gammaproteobacteria bacterium]